MIGLSIRGQGSGVDKRPHRDGRVAAEPSELAASPSLVDIAAVEGDRLRSALAGARHLADELGDRKLRTAVGRADIQLECALDRHDLALARLVLWRLETRITAATPPEHMEPPGA